LLKILSTLQIIIIVIISTKSSSSGGGSGGGGGGGSIVHLFFLGKNFKFAAHNIILFALPPRF
jgi:hypothetical protein